MLRHLHPTFIQNEGQTFFLTRAQISVKEGKKERRKEGREGKGRERERDRDRDRERRTEDADQLCCDRWQQLT